jgi:hypothetical protein
MNARNRVHSPIIIVGSPRSGTTMLGKMLAAHPEVAYWEEPRTIWSQGHAWKGDDVLTESDLTPSIARKIDDRFSRFLSDSGRSRFCEKTPSNCLRLRFVHALYPDAKVIHLIRDGRAVVASMLRMLEKPPDSGRVRARLRETPWRDLPSLAPVFFRDTIGRLTRGGRKSFWGPRPPGWREWLSLPEAARLARQWSALVDSARRDLNLFPAENRLEIRYEDLVARPDECLGQVISMTALAESAEFLAQKSAIRKIEEGTRHLGAKELDYIETEAGWLLRELGYPVSR